MNLNKVHRFILLPGQYYDQETGLHYNYYRYYDPETGRYITSDPIGLDGGLNTYTYVGGNPLMRADPRGQFWTTLIGAGAGAYAGYVAGGNWQSAVIGGLAGAVVGTAAPAAAAAAGTAAGEAGSFANLFAASAAYIGISGTTGAVATADINLANGNPEGQGIGYGIAAGILVPLASGEAPVAAAGLEAAGPIGEYVTSAMGAGLSILSSYIDPGATLSWRPESSTQSSSTCK